MCVCVLLTSVCAVVSVARSVTRYLFGMVMFVVARVFGDSTSSIVVVVERAQTIAH